MDKLTLTFKYSSVYNSEWIKFVPDKMRLLIPEKAEVLDEVSELTSYWEKKGREIISAFENVSGLSFKSVHIPVYLISYGGSFSNPLTISLSNGKKNLVRKDRLKIQTTLIHELIHVLLVENKENLKGFYEWRRNNYPNESVVTKAHIGVLAIQYFVMKELDLEKVMIERITNYKGDYLRAWDIIKEVGIEKVIEKIKE